MTAFIVVKLRKQEDPSVGTITSISGIVSNSFSTDANLVEHLCNKLNGENKDNTVKFKVEQVNEYIPESDTKVNLKEVSTDFRIKD